MGYIRNLSNSYKFGRFDNDPHPQRKGEAWGGFFWKIRTLLGGDETDLILATAWQASADIADEKEFLEAMFQYIIGHTDPPKRTAVKHAISARGPVQLSSGGYFTPLSST